LYAAGAGSSHTRGRGTQEAVIQIRLKSVVQQRFLPETLAEKQGNSLKEYVRKKGLEISRWGLCDQERDWDEGSRVLRRRIKARDRGTKEKRERKEGTDRMVEKLTN